MYLKHTHKRCFQVNSASCVDLHETVNNLERHLCVKLNSIQLLFEYVNKILSLSLKISNILLRNLVERHTLYLCVFIQHIFIYNSYIWFTN